MSAAQWRTRLEGMHRKLLEVRARRERPLRDDKVLAGWSGMMIGTFARAGLILDEPAFVEAARRAADYVLTTNRDPAGRIRAVDLLPPTKGRLNVVGRLDAESTGLLLMTNDCHLMPVLNPDQYSHQRLNSRRFLQSSRSGNPSVPE